MSSPVGSAAADQWEPISIEDRQERIKEIDERVSDLDEEFAGTRMTEEARDEWNKLNAERDEHESTVQELQRRKERLARLSNSTGATERAQTEAPAFHRRRKDEIYDLTSIRAESRSEEDYVARLQDNAKRAIERSTFPGPYSDRERMQGHVSQMLERVEDRYGTFARRILATGSPTYDRAFGKVMLQGVHALSAEEQRAMSVGTDTEGGFAVPFDLDPTVILTSGGSLSPLRQIARVEQTTSKTWQGITSQGITVSRSGEGVESGDNSFTIAQPEVSPQRVIADVRFSVEIDQDWAQMRDEIGRLLADAKAREEDQSFVMGDGTGNNPNGVVATLAASSEVLDEANGVTTTNLYKLEQELPVRFRARARFMASKTIYNDVRDLSTGSDGGDLWVRLGSGQPSELLGYPAHEASAMPDSSTDGNRYLLFGDFGEFIIVDRVGMNVEVNPHIVGSNGRWTGQRAIVAMCRNSSLVLVDNAFRVLTVGT